MATRLRALYGSQFRRLPVAALIALAALAGACSGQGSEGVSADAPMLVETSQSFVTIQNKSGMPLTDVSIVLVPYGPSQFTRQLRRIENTERREVPLTEFRGRDGTSLNLRVVRLKAVRIKAQDATGKSVEFEVPWK